MRFAFFLFVLLSLVALSSSSDSDPCINNTQCSNKSQCIAGTCALVPCECGSVQNHTCTPYRCCSDSQCNINEECTNHTCVVRQECLPPAVCCANDTQCPFDQQCTDGKCAPVSCECGVVQNHRCIPYRCCYSSQCSSNENCVDHVCVLKTPEQCTPPDCCVNDGQCAATEQCAVGKCAPVSCGCGFIQNHQCIPYRCCSDSQCNSNENCINHVCILKPPEACEPPGCCTGNLQCAGNQKCTIEAGAKTGKCTAITGCGVIANHAVVETWQCGSEEGCPGCDEGGCIDHRCVTALITAPTTVLQGEMTVIHIEVERKICGDCEVLITDPSGNRSRGAMNEDGDLELKATESGPYSITVSKNQVRLKTFTMKAVAKPSNPPDGSNPVPKNDDLLLPAIVVAIVVVGLIGVGAVVFYLRGRGK